jgi:antitoxin FitA
VGKLIITNLEDEVLAKLELLASLQKKSVKELAGQILRGDANGQASAPSRLGSRIAERFANLGLEFEIPEFHRSNTHRLDPSLCVRSWNEWRSEF